jgi:hypothetical protein
MATSILDATSNAKALAFDTTGKFTSYLPTSIAKTRWQNQVIGVYDLIYPFLHTNYPTRGEVWTNMQNSLNGHVNSFAHNGIGCSTTPMHGPVPPPSYVPNEAIASTALTEAQPLMVRATSAVNAIGYGVGCANIVPDAVSEAASYI